MAYVKRCALAVVIFALISGLTVSHKGCDVPPPPRSSFGIYPSPSSGSVIERFIGQTFFMQAYFLPYANAFSWSYRKPGFSYGIPLQRLGQPTAGVSIYEGVFGQNEYGSWDHNYYIQVNLPGETLQFVKSAYFSVVPPYGSYDTEDGAVNGIATDIESDIEPFSLTSDYYESTLVRLIPTFDATRAKDEGVEYFKEFVQDIPKTHVDHFLRSYSDSEAYAAAVDDWLRSYSLSWTDINELRTLAYDHVEGASFEEFTSGNKVMQLGSIVQNQETKNTSKNLVDTHRSWFAQFGHASTDVRSDVIRKNRTTQNRSTRLTAESYPNPFTSSVAIVYSLPVAAEVTLSIYDITGRSVATRSLGTQSAGQHAFTWNATTNNRLQSGIYLFRIQAGQDQITGKMTLIR
jgi:hypothetical protein